MVSKAQKVKAELRRHRILDLVAAGHTERQIARIEQISPSMVHKDIKRVLSDHAKQFSAKSDSVRAVQDERYNTLLSVVWPEALDGDPGAINRALTIMNHQNQIHGLYQTTNIYDQRQQLLVNNSAPITFRITDNDDRDDREGIQTAAPIPEAEGGDIY